MTIYTLSLVVAAICVSLLALAFPGYELLLRVVARLWPRRETKFEEHSPPVTLLISAYNEEDVLAQKIESCLALEYPTDSLHIVVVSDASTDRTDEIVEEYARKDSRVRLLRMEERRGKTIGLNRALSEVRTPLVVFSDANAMYDPQAVKYLVGHFADEKVGYVVGAALYKDDPRTEGGRTEGRYWSRELRIKELESRVSSVVGGDGAIYAIRTHLFEPLQETDINDYVNPMQIILKKHIGVFEPRARCWEDTAGSLVAEVNRKRRIVNRSFAGLLRTSKVLNPLRFGFFSVQVWLHKVLRWLSPLIGGLGLICATVASVEHTWLRIPVLACWTGLLVLALILARVLPGRNTPGIMEATYALGVALASLRAVLNAVFGKVQTTWEPRGQETTDRRPVAIVLISALVFLGPLMIVVAAFCVHHYLPEQRDTWLVAGLALAALGTFGHFVLYCPLLFAGNLLRGTPASPTTTMDAFPSVVLVIAAYNEAKVIRDKVENSLALDYPGAFKTIVASDGSDDGTDDIVREFSDPRLELFRSEQRAGKAGLLRRVLETTTSEIVVFSDANAYYDTNAITNLVKRFADAKVGAVTGSVKLIHTVLTSSKDEDAWFARFEKATMRLESRKGSCASVDGAMVAVRRELIPELTDGTILDDLVLAMGVVNRGRRVVFEPSARGREYDCSSLRGEYERRARILAGIVQLYRRRIGLPFVGSGILCRFLGHKVWRWASPLYSISFLALILLWLGVNSGLLTIASGIGLSYLLLAALKGFRVAALKLGYVMVNQIAAFTGLYRGISGQQAGAWRRTER